METGVDISALDDLRSNKSHGRDHYVIATQIDANSHHISIGVEGPRLKRLNRRYSHPTAI